MAVVGRRKPLPRGTPVKLFFNYSKVKLRALKRRIEKMENQPPRRGTEVPPGTMMEEVLPTV